MKTKKNASVVMGLMWYGADELYYHRSGNITERLRHNCRMEDDLKYRWEIHNSKDYGRQVIEDDTNNVILETSFLKTSYNDTKQSWVANIKGNFKPQTKYDSNPRNISLIVYFALEGYKEGTERQNSLEYDEENNMVYGFENGKKAFNFRLNTKGTVQAFSVQNYRKSFSHTWRVKELITADLKKEELRILNQQKFKFATFPKRNNIDSPNIIAIQYVFTLNCEMNIGFTHTDNIVNFFSNPSQTFTKFEDVKENYERIEKEKVELFNRKFDNLYNIKNFEGLEGLTEVEKLELREMSKQALSNVLGGIGFFWGPIKINTEGLEYQDSKEGRWYKGFRYTLEPKGLLTGTPSRSFFARGFLWDEGFHNIIISQWNRDLSMEILDSWLSTMSATGWIPREQIRGAEAESQVPRQFIIQDRMIGNPPTFIFPLNSFINDYKLFADDLSAKSKEKIKKLYPFLKKVLDKMSGIYEWFENYQKSTVDKLSFHWQGRNSQHNLASGLDDYPRGMNPNIHEKHLDLQIWVIEFLQFLRNISEIFDNELVDHFDKRSNKLKEELFKSFNDKDKSILNDYIGPQFKLIRTNKFKRSVPPVLWRGDNKCGEGNPNPLGLPSDCNPYSDLPCCSEFGWCGNTEGHCNCPKCKRAKKLEDNPQYNSKENIFSPHIGYVNMYPLMFGLLKKEDPLLKSTLNYLSDKDELFSDYGVRSLSKSDLLYHTGDDYWRGNIWMNMNYLILRGLFKFYYDVPEAKQLYTILRRNIIKSVFNEWKLTRMFYEQYSDVNGRGVRARPFNGWTSLILNIVSENYHQ
jgi:mannosyl-oligosaccharide glucosidase